MLNLLGGSFLWRVLWKVWTHFPGKVCIVCIHCGFACNFRAHWPHDWSRHPYLEPLQSFFVDRWLLLLLLVPPHGAGSLWTRVQNFTRAVRPCSAAAALIEGPQLHFRPKADRVGLASRALPLMSWLLLWSVFDLIRAGSWECFTVERPHLCHSLRPVLISPFTSPTSSHCLHNLGSARQPQLRRYSTVATLEHADSCAWLLLLKSACQSYFFRIFCSFTTSEGSCTAWLDYQHVVGVCVEGLCFPGAKDSAFTVTRMSGRPELPVHSKWDPSL